MSYASEVLADSPILYLRFQEAAGATCADTSPSGFSGTAHGTFTRNTATGFTGTTPGITLGGAANTDYISVPDAAALELTGQFCYEAWVNLASISAANVVMSKGYVAVNTGGAAMYIDSSGFIHVNNAYSGNTLAQQTTGTAVTTGAWFHVVGGRGAANQCDIFVNGARQLSATSATVLNTSAAPFVICGGSENGTITNPLNGAVDEVAVYTSLLSPARVAAHYAARNTAGGGGAIKSPPGAVVSIMAHDRNAERKQQQGEQVPPSRHRARLDYRRKRGR
jgi:hypothetical protein